MNFLKKKTVYRKLKLPKVKRNKTTVFLNLSKGGREI